MCESILFNKKQKTIITLLCKYCIKKNDGDTDLAKDVLDYYTRESLSSKTVTELKKYASDKSIKIPGGLGKQDIIEYLTGHTHENTFSNYGNTQHSLKKLIPVNQTGNDYKQHLKEHGWTVVPVLSDKFKEYKSLYWDMLEDMNKFLKRNDSSTWKKGNEPHNSHGVIRHSFGHTKLQWDIREQVHGIFADIYGTDKLSCSFDGGGVMFPTEQDKFKEWFHTDYPRSLARLNNRLDSNKTPYSIQGIFYLTDSMDINSGGFICIDKSHLLYDAYHNKYRVNGIAGSGININDKLIKSKKWLKINVPAGSILLFDSRLMHCNITPTIGYRMVLYIAMAPTSWVPKQDQVKRKKYQEENRMTTHWTFGPWFQLLPKNPYFARYGNDLYMISDKWFLPYDKMTKIQKSMVF